MVPTQRPPVPGSARRALPLRAYFAGLFVARRAGRDRRRVLRRPGRRTRCAQPRNTQRASLGSRQPASSSATTSRCSRPPLRRLAANPQIAAILTQPGGLHAHVPGPRRPDRGHLDIIRADGTVACSSRKLTPAATRTGYAGSSLALRRPREAAVPRARARRARWRAASRSPPLRFREGRAPWSRSPISAHSARTSPSSTAAAARRSS